MAETRDETVKLQGTAQYWQMELDSSDQSEKDWRERGRAVVARYRDERETDGYGTGLSKQFNILWSNTETMKGALFARMPKADVRRRYSDNNPITRQVAIVLERALQYGNEVYSADKPIKAAIEDYLLPGRGVVWVVYEPIFVKEKIQVESLDEFGNMVMIDQEEERIADQRCYFDYVNWEDYRESPAKRPEDVYWKARRHLLTRDELIEKGFKNAKDIPLNWSPEPTEGYQEEYSEIFSRAEVWEIWDKYSSKRFFISKGYNEVLAEDDDPYELENFFPCPDSLVAIRTNETNVPIPEFTLYQDQADELDRITTRISNLIEGLKRRGIYDASVPELSHLADAGDNDFVPSENFAQLAAKGGLQSVFQQEDIAPIAQVLSGLYQQRNQILDTIYQITGISDIIRGSTKASETATAQQLKAQFGSMRMRKKQSEIAEYIRDLFRLKAEIIAEHYEPETLAAMTALTITPEMMQIMRDDKLRGYSIDIESDATIFTDEEEEKKTRIEFLSSFGAYLQQAIGIANQSPALTPLAFQALRFLMGAWKVGRTFEDVIDRTEAQLTQQAQQALQAGPQPSEAERIAAQKMQTEMAKEELKQQGKLADIQARERTSGNKVMTEAQSSQARANAKKELALLESDMKIAEEMNKEARDELQR
tara:strand:+ start:297 stop:2255 length:1959 start_codon:yes stop_codon:yes gene_type:complete